MVAHLAKNPQFAVIASLAGVTSSPLPLAARVHSGGFGGGEGMAAFCQAEEIDAIIDVTHPFARQISRNAAQAAQAVQCTRTAKERVERENELFHVECLARERDSDEQRVDPILEPAHGPPDGEDVGGAKRGEQNLVPRGGVGGD